jgi:hypothetical protein
MTDAQTFYLFYIGTPFVIVALAFVAVRLHEWADDKERARELHAAE